MERSSGPSGIDSVACSATMGETANSAAAMMARRWPMIGRVSHQVASTARMPASSRGRRYVAMSSHDHLPSALAVAACSQ